uniref:Uncharacterized protein n=1 Tax=Octopus bimaculoides TaxID=37653 RepID=A0A0L8GAD4_OCTBM
MQICVCEYDLWLLEWCVGVCMYLFTYVFMGVGCGCYNCIVRLYMHVFFS